MNIPDKLTFTKPQQATLVVQQTQTQMLATLDFTSPGLRYEINPAAQIVMATIPGINRPQVRIMGAGTATPYKDGHTEQDRRAAVLAALGIATSAIAAPATAGLASAATS